ncbi:alpha/beta hydrolase [Homoserinibacter sp. GY 40078]|uniref:alpha/beta hydrolase n=1 Tax=Homoserinibacter sp. GY 40078 TaxID=2603275 RepID=UPI0011C71022|nr:dienelactone hydrolase family protein [Homoserinibacter sp. GY 40078]TXK19132.1 phospholipase [Homoserinibacter sp. GY 40078]
MTALSIDPDLVVWSDEPDACRGRPLVLLLHGRGSDEHDLASLASLLPARFVYASLRGPHPFGPAWAWFDDAVETPGDPSLDAADAAADAVLGWLRHLPWVPPRVGALGFSQGGALAVHLLRQSHGAVSFAANLSGFVVGGEHPADARLARERPAVYWGRGTVDPFFTPALIARAERWLAHHTALTGAVYPGLGHAVSDQVLSDVAAFLRARS